MNDHHFLTVEQALKKLNSKESGLSSIEAKKRLKQYGYNQIEKRNKSNPFLVFLSQFKDPLVYILLIASLIAFILKEYLNTGVILGIVIIDAFLGFFHEAKAEQALEKLAQIITTKSKVKRNGNFLELASSQIVPGDIIDIEEGMRIPADMRIIESYNIQIDESVLTGESLAVHKLNIVLSKSASLGDRKNMLYAGTSIISGRGIGLVTATGKNTEFGKIAEEVDEAIEERTSLEIRMSEFGKRLLTIIIVASVCILFIGILKGMEFYYLFFIVVAITIAAIPEGLPAIITITLAYGASKMAERKAIVRRLSAVETLGSINVIASDKTGTLTHNQQMVEKVYTNKVYTVNGSGYEPYGSFYLDQEKINLREHPDLIKLLSIGALCNNSEIFEKNNDWYVDGDPTEGALVCLAEKASIDKETLDKKLSRLDEIPFETKNAYMITLHRSKDNNIIAAKGAIEKILNSSKYMLLNGKKEKLTHEFKDKISQKNQEFARSALRVIAVAYKEAPMVKKDIDRGDLKDLIFVGLCGMIDPPREEASDAIKRCRESGIRPIMITGDYPLTAKAIALAVGLIDDELDKVLSGEELEKLNPKEFSEAIKKYSVFARISPEIKLRIVQALQKQGNLVAVTGDGINDAPALKQADIGVAMGKSGSEVSREVADLVLMDDNFATIVAAIEEGRTIFQNIRRTVFYLLSTNAVELLVVAITLIFGWPLILIPVQMLWMNLVTSGTSDIALALEPTHKGLMKYKPRSLKAPILSNIMIFRIVLVSLLITLVSIVLFKWQLNLGASNERARTYIFAFLVLVSFFNTFNARSLRESIFKIPFFSNPYIVSSVLLSLVLSLATIYVEPLQKLFSMVSLKPYDWVIITILSLSVIVIVEADKFFKRRVDTAY